MTSSWPSSRPRTVGQLPRDQCRGVAAPGHGRVPSTAPDRPSGSEGLRQCGPSPGDDPCPAGARALGGSGYWRLSVDHWRVLYRPDGDTVTVHILKVGRVT
ncbi:type II toxin-antitoxin system RelE family toxin [Streptomyces sp. LZ34]